jgi:hypothetical protein
LQRPIPSAAHGYSTFWLREGEIAAVTGALTYFFTINYSF